MIPVRIEGSRAVNFTTDDGKVIEGMSIYITYPEDGVTGRVAEKAFLHKDVELPKGTKIGSNVELYYNKKGKVIAVRAVE